MLDCDESDQIIYRRSRTSSCNITVPIYWITFGFPGWTPHKKNWAQWLVVCIYSLSLKELFQNISKANKDFFGSSICRHNIKLRNNYTVCSTAGDKGTQLYNWTSLTSRHTNIVEFQQFGRLNLWGAPCLISGGRWSYMNLSKQALPKVPTKLPPSTFDKTSRKTEMLMMLKTMDFPLTTELSAFRVWVSVQTWLHIYTVTLSTDVNGLHWLPGLCYLFFTFQ